MKIDKLTIIYENDGEQTGAYQRNKSIRTAAKRITELTQWNSCE